MQNAFGLQGFQISGGPSWYQTDHYNIEAKGDGKPATREQVFLMLRALLEDRFQLKYHRETRELPVYALSLAKGGPKLPQPTDSSCTVLDPNAPPPPPAARGQLSARPCGVASVMLERASRASGGKIQMAEMVRVLSMIMDRPVIDRTGYTGTFDLQLDFTPDEATSGMPRSTQSSEPGAAPAAPDPTAPPQIFAALQEQLGLRLESAKGPVEILVIDHIEKPSQN
jgi:uncharacterized protein (TIGR03435 family)